ncbi:MAG: response regulator [Candidatus Hermodarchaeota archaeon]
MVKILIVENDKNNRELIAFILKKRGFEVLEAINGQAGVEMAIKENPDLILMDIELPIMNGFKATETLRKNKETKDVPIIAVSGHAQNGHADKAFNLGFTDYLIKPFSIAKFLMVVNSHINKN